MEWYTEVPEWWNLPPVDGGVCLFGMEVGSRGFSVLWAMYVDDGHEFWLNGNYSVHPYPSEKACLEVARTQSGYYGGSLLRRSLRASGETTPTRSSL